MDEAPRSPRQKVLQAFREALERGGASAGSLLPELDEQGLLEQALLELKRRQTGSLGEEPLQSLRLRLEQAVSGSRARRMQQWQLDPERRAIRLRLAVRRPACLLHPPALQASLAQALLEAGVPVAMGLEKAPRPMVRLGHPLPQGIEGLSEWADAALREPLAMAAGALADRINGHCPEGLRILQVEGISKHASPVLELCRKARWAWSCPGDLQAAARDRLARFEAAASYEIAKVGKVEGHKQVKRIQVRPLVLEMGWEAATFRFATRLSPAEALNPVKLLAGILEVEAAAIQDLTRVAVELGEDPRLAQAEKYEPKLHNIFEDAVLLDSDSNIQLIDEEDDEPILLRPKPGKPFPE